MSLIVELIKYLMILMFGVYTFYCFRVFAYRSAQEQGQAYHFMSFLIILIHLIGSATLIVQVQSMKLVRLYAIEVTMFFFVLLIYRVLYPKISRLLIRNMLMLLAISFIMLTRLSYDDAVKQVMIVGASLIGGIIIPVVIFKLSWIKKFGWFYGLLGIGVLLLVLVAGVTNYGATNWIRVFNVTVQPSEVVKLLFVFSIASLLRKDIGLRRLCLISAMAGANVLILVFQRDLGGALIFFVTYLFMLYAATSRPLLLFFGLIAGSGASFVAYQLFSHVKVRVMAWQNPFRYIDKEGYQITQSLFAIGTGGWFGMGINRGLPTSIPVVESDFIFSAIAEELGGVFAICILLIYISCFMMMINIALNLEDRFYRLLSIGFSVMFAFQVFLSVGGVIKFIPSTGVTLPLLSQGGSSVFVTVIMFMILQGIYIRAKRQKTLLAEDEEDMEQVQEGEDDFEDEYDVEYDEAWETEDEE